MIDSSMRMSPMPNDTAHATRAVFNLTNAYLVIGDQAEHWLRDIDLTDQSSVSDRSTASRVRLAFITIFQFAEDLPDRLAADAVRTRMDWKYALHLPLNGPGFDYTLLREYRQRLAHNPIDQLLLQRLLDQVAVIGLLPLTERQGVSVTDVLTSVSNLSRIEDLFEALSGALVALAACQPDWLRRTALPHWYERYTRLSAQPRLPHVRSEQERFARVIGEDAAYLLAAIDSTRPDGLAGLAEIRSLRQTWQQQFTLTHDIIHWRAPRYDAIVA